MAIEIEKPAPLMLGGKAYYTLTSYEPIKLTVTVPRVTEADIDFAIASLLRASGGSDEDLDDAAWLAKNTPGVTSREELRSFIRFQLQALNEGIVNEQKQGHCAAELARRLRQAVPTEVVAQVRRGVQMSFAQELAQSGLTIEQFLAQSGTTPAELEASLNEQALHIAEQEAALDSFARERKLTVDESEYAQLLGIPAEEYESFVKQAKAAGQMEQLHDAALHAKTMGVVVSECDCTYHHETEEEASERLAQVAAMRTAYAEQAAQEASANEQGDGTGSDTGLHLV